MEKKAERESKLDYGEMILRDKLAIERTFLAKERTILSYVRTGLAIIGVALFFYKFIDMETVLKTVITAILLASGVFLTVYGLYKTFIFRTKRKTFVSSYREEI